MIVHYVAVHHSLEMRFGSKSPLVRTVRTTLYFFTQKDIWPEQQTSTHSFHNKQRDGCLIVLLSLPATHTSSYLFLLTASHLSSSPYKNNRPSLFNRNPTESSFNPCRHRKTSHEKGYYSLPMHFQMQALQAAPTKGATMKSQT